MKLIKDFSIIFVPPILAVVVMLAAVVAYVASLPSVGSGPGQTVAMADTEPDLAGLILNDQNSQSDASSSLSINTGSNATSTEALALSTPAVGTTGSNANSGPAKNSSDELVITSAPASGASQSGSQTTQAPRPPTALMLSASISPANNSDNQFTVTAKTAAAGDTISLSLSCPPGVSATLSTENNNECNQTVPMDGSGDQFSTTLIFTNSGTSNVSVPITALEFNRESISTSTDLSVVLPPTGFSNASYQSIAFSNVLDSYPADGSTQILLWSQSGFSNSDYGYLVLEDSSGAAVNTPFANYAQSIFIPDMSVGSVSFALNTGVAPGTYRLAILDGNNNQLAASSYFQVISAGGQGQNPAQSQSQTINVTLTSGGVSTEKDVAAGTHQIIDWNSNGTFCVTSSSNTSDQSWSNSQIVAPEGSHVTTALPTGQYTYSIECEDASSVSSGSATLIFNVK